MKRSKNFSKIAMLASLLGVASCTTSEPAPEANAATGSALENPIAACQSELATCQQTGRPGCQDEMRACMVAFADWLRAVQEGIGACRERAAQCAVGGTNPLMCRGDYDRCVMSLADEPGDADEDAGVPVATAGAGGAAGGAAGAGGAGRGWGGPGRGGFPGAAGRGGLPFPPGPGLPGLPGRPGPGFPGAPATGSGAAGSTAPAAGSGGLAGPGGLPGLPRGPGAGAEMQCLDALAACMSSGGDLMKCADDARQCLRSARP